MLSKRPHSPPSNPLGGASHLKTSGIFIFSLQCLNRFWIKKTNDFVKKLCLIFKYIFWQAWEVEKTVVEILRKYKIQFAIYILGQLYPKGKLCCQPLVTVLPWDPSPGYGQQWGCGGGCYGHFPKGIRPSALISFSQILAVTLGHVSFLVWINECVGRICEIQYLSGQYQSPRGNCRPSNSTATANLWDSQARPSLPWGSAEGWAPMWMRPHPRPQLTLTEREWPPTHSRWQSGSCPVRGSPALVRGRDFLEPRRMPLLARW